MSTTTHVFTGYKVGDTVKSKDGSDVSAITNYRIVAKGQEEFEVTTIEWDATMRSHVVLFNYKGARFKGMFPAEKFAVPDSNPAAAT